MRTLGWLLMLALSTFSFGQRGSNAIILIPPDAVSRAISPDAYNHDLWIRWPTASNSGGGNRLLSIVTGLDWNAPAADLSFTELSPGHFVSNNAPSLKSRGVMQARGNFVSGPTLVLQDPHGFTSANSLLLGVTGSSQLDAALYDGKIPAGRLVVYSALSWDDAEDVVRRCGGASILIEYPPEQHEQVSAAWLRGEKGVPVPASTRVPGLVPASEALTVIAHPERYQWQANGGAESPQRWMAAITTAKPIELTVVFVLTAFAALAALWSIASEKGGKFARLGIALAMGLLPSLLIAGNAAMFTSLRAWDGLPFVAFFALAMIFFPVHCFLRVLWPGSHPLFPLALFSTVVTLAADPLRTVLSPVFADQPQAISPIAAGLLVAGMTALIAFSLGGGLWCRLLAVAPAFVMLFAGGFAHPWWSAYPALGIVSILAVLAGSGTMRLYWLPGFALWPFAFSPWNGHLAWDVGGLIVRRSDLRAINAAGHAEFLLSPGWLSVLACLMLAILFGTRYMRHQLRRALLAKPETRALFWAALGTAAMGLREPFMLTAALIILIAACLVLLFDAAGTF